MRILFIQTLFILMLTFQLTSCVTTRQTNYLQTPKNSIPTYKDTVSYQDYQLKKGDKLYIQVYSIDEKTNALFNGAENYSSALLSGSSTENNDLYAYIVLPDGNIELPLIGKVSVEGKTLREAKNIIGESLKPVLKLNSVDVRVISKSFSIIGSGKAGHFNFPREKVTIFQALAMADDLDFYTDRSKIRILRQTENGTQIKTFDIRSVDIINSEFYYLEPNDVIFLQPMKAKFFGITTFWTAISTLITTYSFGIIISKL